MTKIALLDSWPNLEESAELEFIKRFIIAADNLGDVEVRRVVTSDDIYDFAPDAVLTSHEFSRKLTQYPTIGLLWSPLSFFVDDEYRRTSVLSYDGYVVGNETLRNYVEDIHFSRPIPKPVGREIFLPTSYMTDINALEQVDKPTLCYMGVHWDGSRHGRVFEALVNRDLVTLYGPETSWKSYPKHYSGKIPFDGRSVQKTLARHGIALCLHKKEHRQQNTPSMRIFEALSVGALPICDHIEFARTELSDVALFVDTTKSPRAVADQIAVHIRWIEDNRHEAIERVRRGKKWFEQNWSLEVKIRNVILPTLEEVRQRGLFAATPAHPVGAVPPDCEIVIRTGGRELSYLKRATQSVVAANSADFPLGIVVVDYKKRNDIRAFVEDELSREIPARYLISEDNGFRSTALWNGLRAVKAPFVAHLDDDDTVHPNHYRQLREALHKQIEAPLAYSGVIKKEDDHGRYFNAVNFKGPANREIKENRELFFMSEYDLTRLAQFNNYIQSNTWMARTDVLQSVLGDDPRLEVVEDVYLYLLLAQLGPLVFTVGATASWHWRSSHADNSMTSVSLAKWTRDGARVARRLENLRFHYTPDLASVKILKPERISTIDLSENFDHEAELEPLEYDALVDGGAALSDRVAFKNFHPAEASGVWSRDPNALMVIKLDNDVRTEGGIIIVEYIASDTGDADRFASFCVDDGIRSRIEARGWDAKRIELILPPGAGEVCNVSVDIGSLYTPTIDGNDNRKLGIHIKSLNILQPRGKDELSVQNSSMLSRDFNSETVVNSYNETTSLADKGAATRDGAFQRVVVENPVLSFYSSGAYAHVAVSEESDEAGISLCKLQNNSGSHSIQFDLVNLLVGEEIQQEYVEFDGGPVFRIYLNGDSEDIGRRLTLLPPRLFSVIRDVAKMDDKNISFIASRDSVTEAVAIIKFVQRDLRNMAKFVLGL